MLPWQPWPVLLAPPGRKTDITNHGHTKSCSLAESSQNIYGYTIGGPVGKPGRKNKLFFFYAHEYQPQTLQVNSGNAIRLRVPTQLERAGDFSQTRDQNGNLLTSIYDASTGAPFPGLKIPAQRLYAPGVAVLNRYPLPTLTQQPGTNYNYEAAAGSYNQLTQQPSVRLDYQVSEKLLSWSTWQAPGDLRSLVFQAGFPPARGKPASLFCAGVALCFPDARWSSFLVQELFKRHDVVIGGSSSGEKPDIWPIISDTRSFKSIISTFSYQLVSFNAGGISLLAGTYVLFASTSQDQTGAPASSCRWGSVGNNTAYPGGQFVYLNNGTDPTQWTTATWSSIAQDLAFQVDGLVGPQATGVPAASTTSLFIGLAGLIAVGLYQMARSRQRASSQIS